MIIFLHGASTSVTLCVVFPSWKPSCVIPRGLTSSREPHRATQSNRYLNTAWPYPMTGARPQLRISLYPWLPRCAAPFRLTRPSRDTQRETFTRFPELCAAPIGAQRRVVLEEVEKGEGKGRGFNLLRSVHQCT